MSLLAHLKTVLIWSKVYSLGFKTLRKVMNLHLLFWEGQSLVDVKDAKLPPQVHVVIDELTLTAQLQSAISVKPQLISCDVCNMDVLNAQVQDPNRPDAIQYPVSSKLVDVKEIVGGPSYKSIGGNDMFLVLQTLLV